MKLQGVILQDNLSMDDHVSAVVSKGAQSQFALKSLKAPGLSDQALHCVCNAILVSRITYAFPPWFGLRRLLTLTVCSLC